MQQSVSEERTSFSPLIICAVPAYIPSATKAKKSYAPYKYEIQMLREQVFNPHMKEQILADAEN